ncbi:hypothetical protein ACLQ2Y_32385, partial [Micromonospora echinospora]|uniref:hypothetical protein n=1 Tax=Micromonospora echinospora TaxID=1877 RepID=UPI003CF044E1
VLLRCCHGQLPPHGHQTMIKKLHESGGSSSAPPNVIDSVNARIRRARGHFRTKPAGGTPGMDRKDDKTGTPPAKLTLITAHLSRRVCCTDR